MSEGSARVPLRFIHPSELRSFGRRSRGRGRPRSVRAFRQHIIAIYNARNRPFWVGLYDCGFWALTVALALRLPGEYPLPLGSRRGINQHGELAVVKQAQRAKQPTADRDLFSFICEEGVREFVAVDAVAATDTNSQRRVAMKVADLTGKYRFLLSAWMMSLTVELGTIGPNW